MYPTSQSFRKSRYIHRAEFPEQSGNYLRENVPQVGPGVLLHHPGLGIFRALAPVLEEP